MITHASLRHLKNFYHVDSILSLGSKLENFWEFLIPSTCAVVKPPFVFGGKSRTWQTWIPTSLCRRNSPSDFWPLAMCEAQLSWMFAKPMWHGVKVRKIVFSESPQWVLGSQLHLQRHWCSHNELDEVLQRSQSPLMLLGPCGSGKSLLLLDNSVMVRNWIAFLALLLERWQDVWIRQVAWLLNLGLSQTWSVKLY